MPVPSMPVSPPPVALMPVPRTPVSPPDPPIYLLDYDGTLARTDRAVADCIACVLQEAGVPRDPADIEQVMGRGLLLDETFAVLAGVPEGTGSARLAARYLALYPDYDRRLAQVFPGAEAALAALRDRGAPRLVVTNKEEANAILSLTHTGLRPLLGEVISARPGQPAKPDPALFTLHIAPLFPGAAPGRFVMVGDTEADLRFARAAGLRSVWARYGFGDRALCAALAPDFTIDSLAELPGLPL